MLFHFYTFNGVLMPHNEGQVFHNARIYLRNVYLARFYVLGASVFYSNLNICPVHCIFCNYFFRKCHFKAQIINIIEA